MSLFDLAFGSGGWLAQALDTAAGVTVTYARGVERVTVRAVVGRTVFASNAAGEARVEFGERDYLIRAADLAFGEPARGDEIIDADGVTWALMTPEAGGPAWRWSDPEQTTWRIHTKRK